MACMNACAGAWTRLQHVHPASIDPNRLPAAWDADPAVAPTSLLLLCCCGAYVHHAAAAPHACTRETCTLSA
eukprot:365946-Chlamydomonas_euryale.AAC.5